MGRPAHLPSSGGPLPPTGAGGTIRRVGMRGLAAGVAACIVLLSPVAARASAPSLDGQLARALAARALVPGVSAGLVVDLATGTTLFARQADTSLEPASNEKLCVTYTALLELGPDYRFRTAVLGEGHRAGDVWDGNLVLKGFGDPSLTSKELAHLAGILWREGIRQVTGHIVGDASWFDSVTGVAGWEPSFYGIESPPLLALVVDRGQWRRPPGDRPAARGRGAVLPHPPGARDRDTGGGRPAGSRRSGHARDRVLSTAPNADRVHGPRQRQLHRRARAEGDRRRGAG